ncbi:unnamed protein product, partial [Brassica rapa subsp. narinosa]
CLVYLFHVLNTGNDNMVFFLLYVDQVVRVIVIQKTLIEHAEKLRQVKAVIFSQQITFSNSAGRKFLRDIQEGSTEGAEVGW